MIPTEVIITMIVSSAISASVGAIVAGVLSHVKRLGKQAVDTDKAMQTAMKLILMDKVEHLTMLALDEGEIAIKQRTLILEMVDTAHTLGANGQMTACANEVKALPTKH